MNNKITLICVVLAISGLGYWMWTRGTFMPAKAPASYSVAPGKPVLSDAIKAALDEKLARVVRQAADPQIVAQVERSNGVDSALSKADITRLDTEWQQTKGVSDFIKGFLTNATAKQLLKFQEDNPGFPEVFVADAYGLNVGQTNKTSDYYQADEDWWVQCVNNGQGKAYYGEIEYDESAKSESVPLFAPVLNAQHKAIGCIKAVLSLAAVQ